MITYMLAFAIASLSLIAVDDLKISRNSRSCDNCDTVTMKNNEKQNISKYHELRNFLSRRGK